MIIKKIYDSTEGTAPTPLDMYDISPADGKVLVCYNLSGGTTTGACNIAIVGKLATNQNILPEVIVTDFVYENVLTGDPTDVSFEHTSTTPWPKIGVYVSGNGEGKRIRVWVAYNETK